jgi:lysozyme
VELNDAGINLIKSFEALRLTAYPDPGTGAEPWTIGYGHTEGVSQGDTCTIDQATQYLQDDLNQFIQGVRSLLTLELNDNQFSALVSFAFNCGLNDLKHSTLLREINANNFDNIMVDFQMYDKGSGHILAGLLKRRTAEANLFMTEIT